MPLDLFAMPIVARGPLLQFALPLPWWPLPLGWTAGNAPAAANDAPGDPPPAAA